jgi:hypothetical protein
MPTAITTPSPGDPLGLGGLEAFTLLGGFGGALVGFYLSPKSPMVGAIVGFFAGSAIGALAGQISNPPPPSSSSS